MRMADLTETMLTHTHFQREGYLLFRCMLKIFFCTYVYKKLPYYACGLISLCVCIPSPASASFYLSDFLIDSATLKQQLEQEPLRYTYEADPSPPLSPTSHQIGSLLAARGHWVSSQPDLQLDPPLSQTLYLKGASLHFMFPAVWTLSGAQLGSYLGVLEQVLKHMEDGVIK